MHATTKMLRTFSLLLVLSSPAAGYATAELKFGEDTAEVHRKVRQMQARDRALAKPADPAAGAVLCANNPFCLPADKRNPFEVTGASE